MTYFQAGRLRRGKLRRINLMISYDPKYKFFGFCDPADTVKGSGLVIETIFMTVDSDEARILAEGILQTLEDYP